MPIGAGGLSPVMMLFNRLMRGLLSQMNRDPINVYNDGLHYKTLQGSQKKNDKGKDTQKGSPIFISGATVAVQK